MIIGRCFVRVKILKTGKKFSVNSVGMVAEQRKKEQEILATWFLQEEYLSAGWFKRLLLRIEFVFRDTRGESKLPPLPDHLRMEIARCILPDIVAYFESERGQREFAEWKAQQEAEKKKKSEVA